VLKISEAAKEQFYRIYNQITQILMLLGVNASPYGAGRSPHTTAKG